jgi:hypothetical protein
MRIVLAAQRSGHPTLQPDPWRRYPFVRAGHEATVYTGSAFKDQVTASTRRSYRLAAIEIDLRDLDASFPECKTPTGAVNLYLASNIIIDPRY